MKISAARSRSMTNACSATTDIRQGNESWRVSTASAVTDRAAPTLPPPGRGEPRPIPFAAPFSIRPGWAATASSKSACNAIWKPPAGRFRMRFAASTACLSPTGPVSRSANTSCTSITRPVRGTTTNSKSRTPLTVCANRHVFERAR